MKSPQIPNIRILFLAIAFIAFCGSTFAQRPCLMQMTTFAYNQLMCERHCKNGQILTVCQRNRVPRPYSSVLMCPMYCCKRRGVCVYP